MGASVECEPWFTGSREKCELDKNMKPLKKWVNLVHVPLWFTFLSSSHFSREPVNHGSPSTLAPSYEPLDRSYIQNYRSY